MMKTVVFSKNHSFQAKTSFQLKTTDLELNRCENTFNFTFEPGAKRYTSIWGGGQLFPLKFVDERLDM